MGGWGPPLRIARRTTRRSLGRTCLVAALIGLPVLAATWMGVVLKTSSPTGETLARLSIGQADARVDVSQYGRFAPMDMPHVLGSGEPAPAEGAETPVRVPAAFDPRPLLPAGSTLARMVVEVGTADIQGPSTTSTVQVMTGDASSPLAKDTIRLDEGRVPASGSEVAISPALAKYLGIRDLAGATVRSADGTSYPVVGLVRSATQPAARTILAPTGSSLVTVDPTASVRYLVDLPESVDATTLAGPLRNHGLFLLPRANIVNPPPEMYADGSGDIGPYAAMALAIGFGVLEIVLLAGTAFAVGARRQTHELGLVMATGGTARDVRRIVLLQGLFAGVVGVTAGLLLAAVRTDRREAGMGADELDAVPVLADPVGQRDRDRAARCPRRTGSRGRSRGECRSAGSARRPGRTVRGDGRQGEGPQTRCADGDRGRRSGAGRQHDDRVGAGRGSAHAAGRIRLSGHCDADRADCPCSVGDHRGDRRPGVVAAQPGRKAVRPRRTTAVEWPAGAARRRPASASHRPGDRRDHDGRRQYGRGRLRRVERDRRGGEGVHTGRSIGQRDRPVRHRFGAVLGRHGAAGRGTAACREHLPHRQHHGARSEADRRVRVPAADLRPRTGDDRGRRRLQSVRRRSGVRREVRRPRTRGRRAAGRPDRAARGGPDLQGHRRTDQ